MDLFPFCTPYTIIYTKWINQNTKTKAIKVLEENIEVNHHDLRFGNSYQILTAPKAGTRQKINELNFIKIKKKMCF